MCLLVLLKGNGISFAADYSPGMLFDMACSVKNLCVRNDADSFTNPGGVWIPDSVIHGIMPV